MARTNIDLDTHLVNEGFKLTGLHTKKELVHKALDELIRKERQKGVLTLEGKIRWTGNLDQMRRARFDSCGHERLARFSDWQEHDFSKRTARPHRKRR